ncbi:hypothetical protein O3I_018170 [Nocardia brasiliensis ATCC 700358]|uniref:Uncharacterized protein n=1 Tax=Nocardia brasiliensis (strain ATCC 700358 / HUJEG-1) TaxID=1133849 RepID=K0EPD0_NOCB7|nr:hypothetical protein O3I_018170 [Nocardia brasiliensis ATCC 700358]
MGALDGSSAGASLGDIQLNRNYSVAEAFDQFIECRDGAGGRSDAVAPFECRKGPFASETS